MQWGGSVTERRSLWRHIAHLPRRMKINSQAKKCSWCAEDDTARERAREESGAKQTEFLHFLWPPFIENWKNYLLPHEKHKIYTYNNVIKYISLFPFYLVCLRLDMPVLVLSSILQV